MRCFGTASRFTRFVMGACLPLLAALSVRPVGAQSLAGDLTSPGLWTPTHAPFSFRLDGRDSAALLPGWTFTQGPEKASPDANANSPRTYTYRDPVTKLTITAEVRSYPEFPNVVDWVLHLRNEGTGDSPILDNILPLNWSFAAAPGELDVRHAKGSDANATDYQPLSEILGPGIFDRLESSAGWSSSRNTLPFFNIQNGNRGLIGAVGWSGDWKAEFWYAKDAKSITVDAGMKTTHLRLHPGEEIRTPRIVLMAWSGTDWMESQNPWRQLLLQHYSPRDHGEPMRGPVQTGSWGSEPIADKLAYIAWMHNHSIPIDTYAVDAGWYAGSIGAEFDPGNPNWKPWYDNRGDWTPSPFYYPNGLAPLGHTLQQDGYGFSLWLEPETAMASSQFAQAHPDWFRKRPFEKDAHYMGFSDTRAMLLDLGNPAARASITATISKLITDNAITWYRQDFNIPPEPYWRNADAPDRIGITEIRHIEGLYRMWDDLLAAHPGLHIDNCASGGRRIDIEMMARSFIIWRTDYGVRDSATIEAQTTALAPWVPEVMAFETYTGGKPWLKPGPYETPESVYRMRAGYDTGLGLGSAGATGVDNPAWVQYFKTALGEYRELQPFFYADFYPLIPYAPGPGSWSAWQWNRPATHDGIMLFLRRPESPYPTMQINPMHLDPAADYQVELRYGYGKGEMKRMKGSELTGMQVHLASAPSSLVILYRRLP